MMLLLFSKLIVALPLRFQNNTIEYRNWEVLPLKYSIVVGVTVLTLESGGSPFSMWSLLSKIGLLSIIAICSCFVNGELAARTYMIQLSGSYIKKREFKYLWAPFQMHMHFNKIYIASWRAKF